MSRREMPFYYADAVDAGIDTFMDEGEIQDAENAYEARLDWIGEQR